MGGACKKNIDICDEFRGFGIAEISCDTHNAGYVKTFFYMKSCRN